MHCFLYADGIVLVAENAERLQDDVEEWTEELKRRGLPINQKKKKLCMLAGKKKI